MSEVFERGDTVIETRPEDDGEPEVLVYEAVGRYPFGQPARTATTRHVDQAAAFVLGVYPSALHVRWRTDGVQVSALAVDNEPWPFWDGETDGVRAARVRDWKDAVGWSDKWGTATDAGPVNGSSGRWLRERVLEPLDLRYDRVWLTDALPIFHVHRGRGTQGEAMLDRYDRWALEHGLHEHDLPTRPPVNELVATAVSDHSERLRDELRQSGARLIISLGNEALAVLRQLVDEEDELPRKLVRDVDYGHVRQASLDGRRFAVRPLLHPGQRAQHWRLAHSQWVSDIPQR